MNTHIMKLKASTRVDMVYLYSRYIIKNYGEAYWHRIIAEYLDLYTSLELTLQYEDDQFQDLLFLSEKFTGMPISKILAGFDYYQSVIQNNR